MIKTNTLRSTRNRVLSLILAAITIMLFLPQISASAAGDVPDALRVGSILSEHSYTSAALGDSVSVRDIPVTFSNSDTSFGFCYKHNSGLTSHTTGYRWKTDGNVINASSTAAAPFLSSFYYGLENGTYNDWEREVVSSWVQVAVWMTQTGQLNDYSNEAQLRLLAAERVSVLNLLGISSTTVDESITLFHQIISRYESGDYGALTAYVYYFDDASSNMQPILVGFLEPVTNDYPVYIKLSKTVENTAGFFAGSKFGIYADFACTTELDTMTTTASQWNTSKVIWLSSETATLYVKEISSGDSTVGKNNGVFSVAVNSATNNTVATAATVVGDGADGSIVNIPVLIPTGGILQKVDAATGGGLPGGTFRFLGNAATGGLVDLSATTDAAGIIELQWLDSTAPNYIPPGEFTVTEEIAPPSYEKTDESRHLRLWVEVDGEGNRTAQSSGTLIFENYRKHTLTLRKTSDGSLSVAGAVFDLFRNGTKLGTYTTSASGTITFPVVDSGYYEFLETAAPSGMVLPFNPRVGIYIDAKDTSITEHYVSMKNYEYPEIIITKQSKTTNLPLAGATYEVKIDATTIGTFTTSSTGRITIGYDQYREFLDGSASSWTVTVTEVSAPDSHFLPAVVTQTNEIRKGQVLSPFSYINAPYPDVLAYKYDAKTAAPLEGAVFTLTGKDNSNSFTSVSGTDGIARFEKVPVGTYELRESISPAHYILSTEVKTVVVREDGAPELRFEFSNLKKPSLIIRKHDITDGALLPGAEFSVAYKNGAVIWEGMTDSNGEIRLEDLDPSWITITELAPPEGWLIITPSRDVELKAGEDLEIKIDNIKCPTLEINKLDKITHDGLGGVHFNVKFNSVNDFSGGVVDLGDFVTDANGKILLNDNQKSGWYRVTEVAPKTGYAPANPSYQDIFLAGGDNKVLTFENTPLSALIIRKTDLLGKPVPGATFTVRYLGGTSGSGGTIIHTGTTSPNGTIVLTGLAAGTYVVEETIAAPSFELSNPTVQTAYLSGNDQDVVELLFTNPKMGRLVITKLSLDRLPLAGAQFKVTFSDGGVIGPNNGIYTTDASGVIIIDEDLPIGSTVVVSEQVAPDGFVLDGTPQTVKIKENTTHNLFFYNAQKSGLQIIKVDKVTKQPLKGVEFTIYKKSGDIIGTYVTDKDGVIIVSELEPGWVKIVESKSLPGYALDDTPQDVEIKTGEFHKIVFENIPLGGLQILKFDADNRTTPLPNTEFAVSKMNGERIGVFTTDANGQIFIPMEPGMSGWLSVVESKASKGFLLDTTIHNIEVKDGQTAVLRLYNKKAAGVLLQKVDSVTGKGIYGVQFLLSDAGNNPVGQYTSDQDGWVYIGFDGQLTEGKYFLRELRPADGYVATDEIKTIYLEAGKTSQITWKNTAITAQIQVVKYSQDYNPVTGAPAGSLLKGAVFEITQARSGAVVGYITTDARGVAASPPLPLGRYFVKEVTAAPYTQLNPDRFEAELEYAGQIVRLAVYNKSATLSTEIKKVGNLQVIAGDSMRYDLSIKNASNVPLSEFYWSDRIPTDAARIQTLTTGTYNQRLYYRVVYKTNTGIWRTLATNLLTTNNYSFSLHANALGLANGEVVTDVKLEFGTVPAGFASVVKPTIAVQTIASLPKGYIITNRAYVGGKYLDAPQESTTAWVTEVIRFDKPQQNPSLPKTGY